MDIHSSLPCRPSLGAGASVPEEEEVEEEDQIEEDQEEVE